jgi:hypothetical protein
MINATPRMSKSPPLHEAYITVSGYDDILIKPSKGILATFSMRCTIVPIQLLTGTPKLSNGSMLLELPGNVWVMVLMQRTGTGLLLGTGILVPEADLTRD